MNNIGNKIKTISLCLLMLSLLPALALAVPQIMSYQGKLNDRNGVPVNGSVTMTFSMYSSVGSPSSAVLWSETKSVPVASGSFNTELGTGTVLPDSMFRHNNLYLGIKVGADNEMTPRQRVTSGAFTFRSYKVEFPVVPIGSVMAWMKSYPNVPALPDGWVECNGQTLIDLLSPFNGQVIPNLNGENRFLRGATASANTGGSTSHQHNLYYQSSSLIAVATSGINSEASGVKLDAPYYNGTITTNLSVAPASSIPPYYDVVWIMKVK